MYIAFYFKAVAQYFHSSKKNKGPELNHDIRNIDLELSICLFLYKSSISSAQNLHVFNTHKNLAIAEKPVIHELRILNAFKTT